MRTDNAWERIGDRAKRDAASAMIRLARGILLGYRKLHQAGLMNLADAKSAYHLSGEIWRLGWLLSRPRGRHHRSN